MHIRERYIRAMIGRAEEAEERLHRLEIAHQQLKERFDLLEEQSERLRGRLDGARGGRPPKQAAPSNDLSSIPVGDKVALRRALGVAPK